MSTKYKHSHEVPTAVLAKRLEDLSDAVGKRGEERDRELTRRIPAELDRDADLVLSEAAQRLLKMEAERDTLAAQLNRNTVKLIGDLLREGLEPGNLPASIARQKTLWQAEALEWVRANPYVALNTRITELRRQAEGGEK